MGLNFDWTRLLPLILTLVPSLSIHKGTRKTAVREWELLEQHWALSSAVSDCLVIYVCRFPAEIYPGHFSETDCDHSPVSPSLKSELSAPVRCWQPALTFEKYLHSSPASLWWLVETAESRELLLHSPYLTIISSHHITSQLQIHLPSETGRGLSRNRSVIFWI